MYRLSEVLAATDARLGEEDVAGLGPWATGFDPLDGHLAGGLRRGELTLLGGPQGLGKTTFALQVARTGIAAGHAVLYVSFEHGAVNLLERLLAAESGELAGDHGVSLKAVRALLEGDRSAASLQEKFTRPGGSAHTLAAITADLERLHVLRGGPTTDIAAITAAIDTILARGQGAPLVVIDYLQKIAAPASLLEEETRMSFVAGAIKDLALAFSVPVLAISASDAAGIAEGARMRTQNLRGASALAYEADVVLVLNEKYDVVARHHLVYGSANPERFHLYAVMSIEKNRGGRAGIDLEFRKRFDQAMFEREGQVVAEQLIDSRIFVE